MDALDNILHRYTVSDPSANRDGKLLGASFILLKENGAKLWVIMTSES